VFLLLFWLAPCHPLLRSDFLGDAPSLFGNDMRTRRQHPTRGGRCRARLAVRRARRNDAAASSVAARTRAARCTVRLHPRLAARAASRFPRTAEGFVADLVLMDSPVISPEGAMAPAVTPSSMPCHVPPPRGRQGSDHLPCLLYLEEAPPGHQMRLSCPKRVGVKYSLEDRGMFRHLPPPLLVPDITFSDPEQGTRGRWTSSSPTRKGRRRANGLQESRPFTRSRGSRPSTARRAQRRLPQPPPHRHRDLRSALPCA